MQKKVLFCATVDSHIVNFHVPYLEYFKSQGYEVHVATGENQEIPFCDKKHTISITKTPYQFSNLNAYRQLKVIIEKEAFQLIHCHTPMGGVITRLAARAQRKRGTKVFYTAHGFHFYKGAPLINWMIYYPIEKWLSHYTDCLITLNSEDYHRAINSKFQAKRIEKVNGVGVNLDKFKPLSHEEKNNLKVKYGYSKDDFILMYIAELNTNKNQQLLLNSMHDLNKVIPNLKVILIGKDFYKGKYQQLAQKLEIAHQVDFLGVRNDIDQLMEICDIYVATSIREGLPVNIMEAMAMGLPICATRNRGHVELIEHQTNGYLVETKNREALTHALIGIYQNKINQSYWKEENKKRIKKLAITEIRTQMQEIYIRSQEGEINEPTFYSV